MNARRYPRTLQEAFGPYTSREVLPMRDKSDYSPAWWAAICIVAVLAVLVIAWQ